MLERQHVAQEYRECFSAIFAAKPLYGVPGFLSLLNDMTSSLSMSLQDAATVGAGGGIKKISAPQEV